ncbi:MAG: efflux RND transporter periplasmic adaptor subunit [Sulfuriferula sp.]
MSPAWAGDDDAPAAVSASDISVVVQTVPLRRQILSDEVSAYGVVAMDARHVQTLSLARAGQIVGVNINIGQRVSKGTPLLTFATSPDAALTYRQAGLAVRDAQAQRRSVAQLFQQQLATQSQLAAADKALADAQANLATQQKNGTGKAIEQLVAPFDALVSAVAVMPGDRVAPGVMLVQLARSGGQRVMLGVEPGDADRVRAGMPVQITAVFGTAKAQGRVAQVFGLINAQTQLVDALVELPNAALLPGTHVRGDIQLGRYPATVVPRSAVLRDAQGAYLFQVERGKARRVAVQPGLERSGMVAVSGALIANAPVVSLGNYELQDGMAVRISP